jgi:hypothetical protein
MMVHFFAKTAPAIKKQQSTMYRQGMLKVIHHALTVTNLPFNGN